jgi:hypothetical protein
MASRDKQLATGSTAAESAAIQSISPVESLPLTALALIYEYCNAGTRNSLLRTSRWGRDMVLGQARTVSLELHNSDTPGARKPLVRLFHRVCSAGVHGRLTVCVDAQNVHANSTRNKLLRDLLAPGVFQRHGWTSVGTFKLRVGVVTVVSVIPVINAGHVCVQQDVCSARIQPSPQVPCFLLTCRETWEPQPL